ncbi:MAG TPA: hypothetical protein VFE37_02115 [Chloroflexota bacterium]|nr:hypothetical protein [Chloroflexota bacterium]
MDLFLAAGFAMAAVVLFAAFGLAMPELRRPLLVASAALVAGILAEQALIGLVGAQNARLTLLAAAFLGIVLVAALVWRRRQPG